MWVDDKNGALPGYYNADDLAYTKSSAVTTNGFTGWQSYLVDQ
jgi:hypothetical protein